ncbi:MAG: hypothetical protein IKB34_05225 [Clostridia bacterium]|nr:hypothetical protein [Clostridia bacterium]
MNTENNAQKLNVPDGVLRNKLLSTIAYTARVVALICASGPLMQTFLASLGFDTDLIYLHSTLLQAANVLTIVLFSQWANTGVPIKRSAFSILPTGLLFLFYVPFAIASSTSPATYVLLAVIGIAQQISIGLFTVCEYKIPYYIYRPNEYGMILSVCGIVSSLFSLGSSALISHFTSKIRFTSIMAIAFSTSAALITIAFVCIFFEKSLLPKEVAEKLTKRKDFTVQALLRYPTFTHLIHANLMRGFAAGIISVLATVALDLGYTESLTAVMVSAQSVASLATCALFSCTSKRISPQVMLIIGCIMVLSLPALLISSSFLFLSVFVIITVGRTLIDYSVPIMLLKTVPVEIAGPYHAWRMVLQNAGTLTATALAAALPIPCMLIIASVFQMISGISFVKITKAQNDSYNIS